MRDKYREWRYSGIKFIDILILSTFEVYTIMTYFMITDFKVCMGIC